MGRNIGPFPQTYEKTCQAQQAASKQQKEQVPVFSLCPSRHSGSFPLREQVASLRSGSLEQLRPGHCHVGHSTGARLRAPSHNGLCTPSKGVPFSRAWGRAFSVLWGREIMLQRVGGELVLGSPRWWRGAGGTKRKGRNCVAARVPV